MAGIELYAVSEAKHKRTWTAATIVLTIVFVVVGQLLTLLPLTVYARLTGQSIQELMGMSTWPSMAVVLFSFAFTSLLVFLWVWLFERRGLATIGLNGQGAMRFGRGFLIGLGFLAAVVGIIYLLGGYRVEAMGVWGAPSFMALLPIFVLLLGFCIQGSTEEIVMRGWMMQIIASRHGIIWAMVGNAIVFSLLHGGNIEPSKELVMGLVNIVLVGVFFSVYAIKERSLWGVCGWHAAWNWLLGLGFGLEVSGQKIDTVPLLADLMSLDSVPWWLTGGKFGPEGSVVCTAVLLVGLVWLIWQGALKPDPSLYVAKVGDEF